MNSERNIITRLYESKYLEEASFEVNGSTYKCVFGKYYKDEEPISREDYFKAKDGDTTSRNSSKSSNKEKSLVYDEDSIVKASYKDVPKYLYHATFSNYLDDIAEKGLGVKDRKTMGSVGSKRASYSELYNDEGTFFAEDPEEALSYMSGDDRESGDIVLLRIPKSALNKDNIYYDMNNSSTSDYLNGVEGTPKSSVTYFYKGVIDNPQSKMTIMDY